MSTNYYTVKRCGHCNHEERLHIGKSASGWCFALATHPEANIAGLDDWRLKFAEPGLVIEDEYGQQVTAAAMLETITERSGAHKNYGFTIYSEPGPKGLQRCRVDGRHCIAHGDGTWDIMQGYFH